MLFHNAFNRGIVIDNLLLEERSSKSEKVATKEAAQVAAEAAVHAILTDSTSELAPGRSLHASDSVVSMLSMVSGEESDNGSDLDKSADQTTADSQSAEVDSRPIPPTATQP